MSRYRAESANTSRGVLIIFRRLSQPRMPTSISIRHTRPLDSMAVDTAVFMLPYSFAPKSWDTSTEQPILQPNAKARKIRVIS